MAQMKERFPPDMGYVVSLDQTRAVTEGIKEIVVTLLIALALVILVVYLFLQGWRATLIPLLAVPVSLIGTFVRSEEHTSELQSQSNLVCRLLLEKKKKNEKE